MQMQMRISLVSLLLLCCSLQATGYLTGTLTFPSGKQFMEIWVGKWCLDYSVKSYADQPIVSTWSCGEQGHGATGTQVIGPGQSIEKPICFSYTQLNCGIDFASDGNGTMFYFMNDAGRAKPAKWWHCFTGLVLLMTVSRILS
jgi:hypothetical protein